MKDISNIKSKYEKYYAKKCFGGTSISLCPHGEKCVCKIAAEIRAYMHCIIPHPYYKYTIWDFTGLINRKMALPAKVVSDAKEVLLNYCWYGVTLDDLQLYANNKDELKLDQKSIMNARRTNGTNLIIYSPSKSQTGKTLLASIAMREAIKQRSKPGHFVDTYDWISFVMLKDLIRKKSDKVSYLESCDWLVVDNIVNDTGVSRASESYISSIIDPFFTERLEDGFPTIFVFKFDIEEESIRWEEKFGLAIANVVKNYSKYKIKLF